MSRTGGSDGQFRRSLPVHPSALTSSTDILVKTFYPYLGMSSFYIPLRLRAILRADRWRARGSPLSFLSSLTSLWKTWRRVR